MTPGRLTYYFLLFVLPTFCLAQTGAISPALTGQHSLTIPILASDTAYKLPHEFIISGSERIVLDSVRVLISQTDYSLNTRNGILRLTQALRQEIFADSLTHVLAVSYRYLPFSFKQEYFLREIVVRKDSLGKKTISVAAPSSQFSVDDLFGSGLQKSGSIVRGFTVGSNRDLTLNSGFRMQLSGKLTSEIDIVAALTDENSPIQPEGTTQTLQEVDKVFVEVGSTGYSATLGDFNLQIGQKEGGEFGRLFRKLQGAKGTVNFSNFTSAEMSGSVSVAGATARGKFTTNQFQGSEGNQGPYRLQSREGSQQLIVIAGTERVYINGEQMTRGETQDYIIEYASGEVTFTTKRLITNASRITIDFEYTDRQYTRNLVGATISSSALNNRISLSASLIQEADDPDSPIDFTLDDATKNLLRQSGANRFKASISGIRYVGTDSVTNLPDGQYTLRDTTISGKQYTILLYSPGGAGAFYSASFAYVGKMPSDSAGYIRIGVGHFRFAGIGQGNYLPIKFLPIPELHRAFATNLSAQITSDFAVSGEYAFSSFDRNRFSPLDNQEQNGGAFKFSARYNPKRMMLGATDYGELDLTFSERFVDRRFASLDRANEIEFSRKWDLTSSTSTDEEIREGALTYRPLKSLAFGFGYGSLERTGAFRSERTTATASAVDSALPRMLYNIERISSTNSELSERSSWIRQRGGIDYTIWKFQPGIRIETEQRKQHKGGTDSLNTGSFSFVEIVPHIGVEGIGRMSLSAEFQFRNEDSSAAGTLQRASQALTQAYSWRLNEWNSLSSSLTLSIRNTKFTEAFKLRGNSNSEVILVRSQTRFTPLQRALDADVFYEFASERSAKLERAFVRVSKGSGNYRYKGDQNNNSIADEEEFELTRFDGDFIALFLPSDQLVPVVDLKTGFRIRFQPARLIGQASSFWERALKSISTETVARVEEKSSEPDTRQIYLLSFKRFQNDKTTIAGSNLLTQDVHLFENDPALSFRFRISERTGLLQLVSGNERSLLRERSMRVRSQLMSELGNQTEYVNKIDRVTATVNSSRERDLLSDALSSDFSYRPESQWEVGFALGVSRVIDRFGGENATADINEQTIRLTYAFSGVGQLRGELEREEVVVSNKAKNSIRTLPYEFTNGRVVGKTLLWQLAFDYRINQYVQITVNYNGRSEGRGSPVHTARAEARAFF